MVKGERKWDENSARGAEWGKGVWIGQVAAAAWREDSKWGRQEAEKEGEGGIGQRGKEVHLSGDEADRARLKSSKVRFD